MREDWLTASTDVASHTERKFTEPTEDYVHNKKIAEFYTTRRYGMASVEFGYMRHSCTQESSADAMNAFEAPICVTVRSMHQPAQSARNAHGCQ